MARSAGVIQGDDGLDRCPWCVGDPLYVSYHDTEWGRPTTDDRYLFEKICLEGFQAGLSWLTILRKRENFRKAFAGFDMHRVARFGVRDVQRLLGNAGIVRHRGKIESAINNAKRAIELIETEESIAAHVWSFAPNRSARRRRDADIPAVTAEATALSKDLRSRGFTFLGPTTVYAFMQSVGIVNDHLTSCHVWSKCDEARERMRRTPPAAR